MSNVSEVKVPSGNRPLGSFEVGVFNLFEEAERQAYAELRTQGNDRSTGVTIDHIQQFTRVITETESGEEGQVTRRREDLYVVVQYWTKRPAAEAESKQEPPRQWYVERPGKV